MADQRGMPKTCVFTGISRFFVGLDGGSVLGSVWAQLVPKLPLNWPKLRHVGPDLDHMCIKRRRNLRPNPPVGPKFGPSLEPSGPSWAEVWRELGPSRRMLAQLKTMYGQVWRWFGLGSSRPGV
jgi:hypothetical protein